MANRSIKIEVDVDESGAVRRIRALDGSIVDLRRSSDATGRSVFNLGQAFNVAVGNLMAKAAQAFSIAVRNLGRAAADVVGQSADIFETANKFGAVFGSAKGEVDAFISTWATMAGMSQTVAQEFLATTGAILQGAGFAASASAEMSTQVATLAGDLTSFTNIPIEETFGAIQAALVGERERLKRLGIVLQQTEVDQKALALSGKTVTSSLTQQDRATASLALITQKAGAAVGDLEKTQGSAANQMRQIQARIEDLRDAFAVELLPVITEVARDLNDFLKDPSLQASVRALATEIRDGLLGAINVIKSLIRFFVDYRSQIEFTAKATVALTAALVAYRVATSAAAAATALFNNTLRLNPYGLIASAITLLIAKMIDWGALARDASGGQREFNQSVSDGIKPLNEWEESALRARLAFLRMRELQLDAQTDKGPLSPLRAHVSAEAATIARKIQETEAALAALASAGGPGGGGSGSGDAVDTSIIEEERKQDVLRRLKEMGLAHDAEVAAFQKSLRDTAREQEKVVEEERKIEQEAAIARGDAFVAKHMEWAQAQIAAKEAIRQAEAQRLAEREAMLASMIVSNEAEVKSAREARNYIIKSILGQIRAYMALTIAKSLAKLGPAALVIGPVVAAGIGALFSRVTSAITSSGKDDPVRTTRAGSVTAPSAPAPASPVYAGSRPANRASSQLHVTVEGRIANDAIHIASVRGQRELESTGRSA